MCCRVCLNLRTVNTCNCINIGVNRYNDNEFEIKMRIKEGNGNISPFRLYNMHAIHRHPTSSLFVTNQREMPFRILLPNHLLHKNILTCACLKKNCNKNRPTKHWFVCS